MAAGGAVPAGIAMPDVELKAGSRSSRRSCAPRRHLRGQWMAGRVAALGVEAALGMQQLGGDALRRSVVKIEA